MSASTSNMTSLSSKRVAELANKYKSESTKELILKGYAIYWLYNDIKGQEMKKKATKVVSDAVEAENEPTVEQPQQVTTVDDITPTYSFEDDATQKKRSHFKTMYAPKHNYTMSHKEGAVYKKR